MRFEYRKGAFLWNVPESELERDEWVEVALRADLTYIALKTADCGLPFGDREAQIRMAEQLRQRGISSVGQWSYTGLDLVDEEVPLMLDVRDLGMGDFAILNVEIDTNPKGSNYNRQLCAFARRWYQGGGPTPLLLCSHAITDLHPSMPYWAAHTMGMLNMPMIYHTAMDQEPGQAVADSYSGTWNGQPLIPGEMIPAMGAYDGLRPCTPEDLALWFNEVTAREAKSIMVWSLDSLVTRPDLVAAIAALEWEWTF